MHEEPDATSEKHVVGEAMQKLMAEKGCDLTLEESRRFVLTLLHLIEHGLIAPIEATAAAEPEDVASA